MTELQKAINGMKYKKAIGVYRILTEQIIIFKPKLDIGFRQCLMIAWI